MSRYRRNRVQGGTYFFTVNLRDRRSDLLVAEIGALREAVRAARTCKPFHIDGWVVLPDHMHCLWTLPPGDCDFPARWQMIKAAFSRSAPRAKARRASMIRKREAGVWQRRYWEHTIRDDRDYAVHMDYVHFNPVKHGLVATPADWPYFELSQMRGAWGLSGRVGRRRSGTGGCGGAAEMRDGGLKPTLLASRPGCPQGT